MALEEKKEKKSGGLIIAFVLIGVLIAAVAYLALQKPSEQSTAETTVAVEAMQSAKEAVVSPSGEPPQPAVPDNIVAPTKKLEIPAVEGDKKAPAAPPMVSSPEVEAMMSPRTLGSDSAPIKVIEYSSLTCGHCATFHKEDFGKIKAAFIDTGKVQFIFKEFPLNEPAVIASQLLRCMPADRFESFMSLLFAQQDSWAYQPNFKDILKQNAKLAGLSDEQVDACYANEELKARIVGDMKAATDKYKIQSTPTFVVNDGAKLIMGHQPLSFFEETFNEILKATPAPAAETK